MPLNQQDDRLARKVPNVLTDPAAIAEWKRLLARYVFANADKSTLILLVSAYSNALKAQQTLDRDGLTLSEPIVNRSTGNIVGSKIRNHPALATLKTERAHYAMLAKHLGLYEGDDDVKEEAHRAYQYN
jgi:phage terminase small subunit